MFESFDWAVAGNICLPSLLLLAGLVLWRRREKRREKRREGAKEAASIFDLEGTL